MPRVLLQVASVFSPSRVFLYSIVSLLAIFGVIANALNSHSTFYAAAVHLSRSNGNVLVLANFAVLMSLTLNRLVQAIFFGELRTAEVERLYDRLWFFVTESLLAFTIFRDDFDVSFAFMFGFLLFIKSFHWLLSDRVEWMDQRPYPGPPLSFHTRANVLFTLLWLMDVCMFIFIIDGIMARGMGGTILFANEYAILMASLLNTFAKYVIAVIDIRRARVRGGENAPPWEDKSMWIFYVELVTDFLKLTIYLTFFMLVLTFYGLPLNMIRDVYLTARSFIMRSRDLMRYRTATRNMDERYPNATVEEMNAMSDKTCIICREEMALPGQQNGPQNGPEVPQGPNMTPKKLPCGHFFHFYCLRSWLERQQSCPTCRRSVLENNAQGAQPPAAGRGGQGRNVPQNNNVFRFNIQQPQQQAPQGGQLPLGNLGGILNRIAGVGGAPQPIVPQIIPGQNAQGQMPPMGAGPALVNGNPAWFYPGPVQGIGIEPLQVHHEPRAFQGFRGPDGVWHRWDVDVGANNGDANAGTPTTTTVNGNRPQTELAQTSSRQDNNGSSSSDTSQTVRDAAARAALERASGGRLTSQRPETAVPGSAATERSDQGTTVQSNNASSSRSVSTPNPGHNSANGEIRLPTLIPVRDPMLEQLDRRHQPPHINRAGSNDPGPSTVSHLATNDLGADFERIERGLGLRIRNARGRAQQLVGKTRLPYNSATLPLSLSDEQLGRMDTLTREAIDERLKVLEGVQGTVSKCIDDLLRVRSVLPPTTSQVNLVEKEAEKSPSVNAKAPAPAPELNGEHAVNAEINEDRQSEDALQKNSEVSQGS